MDNFLPAGSFIGFLVPEAIDASQCARLLADVLARGFSTTGLRYPEDYRNNDRLVFDDAQLAEELFVALAKELPAELELDGSAWKLEGLNPRFRACRYAGGQGFCVHRDGAHVPSAEVRSALTVQLYLDDAPDRIGGHTRFYADHRGVTMWASIPPAVGTAIVFDHRVWHDGEPVVAGIKHVLRTDAMYRRVGTPRVVGTPDARTILGRHRGYAWKVIVRGNGDVASAGRDGTVRTWGAAPRVTDLGMGSVTALHEVESALWAGTRSGSLALLDDEGGFRQVASFVGAVLSLSHLPRGAGSTGHRLVAATASGALHAFDGGAALWTSQAHASWAWCVAPYRGGLVSVGHDGRVRFTNADGQTRTLAELREPLRAVAARGEELWLGDVHGNLYTLEAHAADYDADYNVRHVSKAHDAAITSIAANEDVLVTGSEDGSVKRWRAHGFERCALSTDFVTSVALSEHGELVCAGYDGDIFVV